MSRTEQQLRRLLRAAANARDAEQVCPAVVPDAGWLMRQRGQRTDGSLPAVLPVLQGGLAVACVILLFSVLVNGQQIRKADRDVFVRPQAVLTQISVP